MILKGSSDDDKVGLEMTCTGPFVDRTNYKYDYRVICKKNINHSEFCRSQYNFFDTSAKIKERLDNAILAPSK